MEKGTHFGLPRNQVALICLYFNTIGSLKPALNSDLLPTARRKPMKTLRYPKLSSAVASLDGTQVNLSSAVASLECPSGLYLFAPARFQIRVFPAHRWQVVQARLAPDSRKSEYVAFSKFITPFCSFLLFSY